MHDEIAIFYLYVSAVAIKSRGRKRSRKSEWLFVYRVLVTDFSDVEKHVAKIIILNNFPLRIVIALVLAIDLFESMLSVSILIFENEFRAGWMKRENYKTLQILFLKFTDVYLKEENVNFAHPAFSILTFLKDTLHVSWICFHLLLSF